MRRRWRFAGSSLVGDALASVHGDGNISYDRHTAHYPRGVAIVIDGVVLGGSVVPDRDVAGCPMPANCVLQSRDVRLKDFVEPVRVMGIVLNEALSIVPQQQALLAGLRVDLHDRVLRLDDLGCVLLAVLLGYGIVQELDAACGIVEVVAMDSPQLVHQVLQGRWQMLVGSHRVGPHGVAARIGQGQGTQD